MTNFRFALIDGVSFVIRRARARRVTATTVLIPRARLDGRCTTAPRPHPFQPSYTPTSFVAGI